MGLRQKRWAKGKRLWLVTVLGGKCKHCGATNCLTLDCIVPTGDAHHRMSQEVRITYYMRQAQKGNLQVLCSECNSRKGNRPQPRYQPVRHT